MKFAQLAPRFLTQVFATSSGGGVHVKWELGDPIEGTGRVKTYGYELIVTGESASETQTFGVLLSSRSGATAYASDVRSGLQGGAVADHIEMLDRAVSARFTHPIFGDPVTVRAFARSAVNGVVVQTEFPVYLVE